MTSSRLFASAGVCLEPGRLDAGERAGLVLVRGIPRNADGADNVAGGVFDQHTTWIGDDTSAARRREHGEKLRRAGGAFCERTRAEAHAEGAPRFSKCNVEA